MKCVIVQYRMIISVTVFMAGVVEFVRLILEGSITVKLNSNSDLLFMNSYDMNRYDQTHTQIQMINTRK